MSQVGGVSPRAEAPMSGGASSRSTLLAICLGVLVLLGARFSGWPSYDSGETSSVKVGTPRVTLQPGHIDAGVRLTSPVNDTISGWFFLSRVSSADPPWQGFAFKSSVLEQGVQRGRPAEFHWSESVAVPADLYQLTFWFHKQVGIESVHVTGGSFGLSQTPITGTAPFHQFFGQAAADVQRLTTSYDQSQFNATIDAHLASPAQQATLSWQLRPAAEPTASAVYTGKSVQFQASDGAQGDARATISDTVSVQSGRYDLWLTIDNHLRGSQPQQVVSANALIQDAQPPYRRQTAADGPFHLGLSSRLPALRAGRDNALSLDVRGSAVDGSSCDLRWRLLSTAGQQVSGGDAGAGCDRPTVTLPDGTAPGRYQLESSAYTGDSLVALRSATIVVDVDVTD